MDYSIPIPIRNHTKYNDDYECLCKDCKDPEKYVKNWDGYSYLWSGCKLCKKRVWYYPEACSLYGRRYFLICFNCRIPYYEKGMSSGEIHKIIK